MNNRIYLFTAPVRSGKTTQLLDWSATRNDVGGFLTPDKDGLRILYDVQKKIVHPFQADEESKEDTVAIGRFCFLKQGFEAGKTLLRNVISNPVPWFIVDEVGKLEIEQGKGFEPELSATIAHYHQEKETGNLLLLIRDSLLNKAIDQYKLQGATILTGKLSIT